MVSFFRYPGGKAKLIKSISKCLDLYAVHKEWEYREPFFGGGSVGLTFMTHCPQWGGLWINDKDVGVASLWTSVICYPEALKQKILDFTPSVDAFDEYKDCLSNKKNKPTTEKEIVECGFQKLAIHQISYSGLGTKSGGPLGGRKQKSAYKIDCRWSPLYICKKINYLHAQFATFAIREQSCTSYDFLDIIQTDGKALIYLDPPYYVKGNDLYQCGFLEEDHVRLAKALRKTEHAWVLSYDDCSQIRDLYSWAVVETVNVNYSITATKNKSSGKRSSTIKPELLIYPK